MFDWVGIPGYMTHAGADAPRSLGEAMRSYWANFAHTGRPFAEGEPDWPPYSISNREVLLFDAERHLETNFDDTVRQFWFDK